MKWPIDVESALSRSLLLFDGLLPREREVLYFIDRLFPPRAEVEFCDVNPTLKWICGSCLEGGIGPRIDGKSPWEPSSPTQVGSGKLVVRHTLQDEDIELGRRFSPVARVLKIPEVMRCIGWSDQYWATDNRAWMSLEEMEMWMNIAGNSYSIWHFIPWYCALLATFGKFVGESPDSGAVAARVEDALSSSEELGS